jgi:hypothetical protein
MTSPITHYGTVQHHPTLTLLKVRQPTPCLADIAAISWNCWLPASTIAVAHAAPDWLSHLFYFPDGTPMSGQDTPKSDTAIVTIWNPSNGQPTNFTVTIRDESLTEDHPGGAWWNSGMTQAFQQMGVNLGGMVGIHPNGTLWRDSGDTGLALAMMTGYHVDATLVSSYAGVEDWFNDVKKVSGNTPVVLSTNSVVGTTEPVTTADHDYSVLETSGTGPGDGWTVKVRNPWGADDVFKPEDLFDNTVFLNHLTGWESMSWDGSWPGH